MFYDTSAWRRDPRDESDKAAGLCVLTSSEGKRLIAQGVAALPEVRAAMNRGRIVIPRTTTNAFVAEELTGQKLDKYHFACGVIAQGEMTAVEGHENSHSLVLIDGRLARPDLHAKDVLMEFERRDVLIKSANAIDMAGNAGVLVYDLDGGSMGRMLTVAIRGSTHIVPTGLEKLVPSVIEASHRCGKLRWRHNPGQDVGFLLLQNSHVVTEIQALAILSGVNATLVAAGGVDGSEGAVVLALEGRVGAIDTAFAIINKIKGEPPITAGPDQH